MHTWEHGIAFGQAIERIKSLSHRVREIEHRVDKVEADVSDLKTWARRGGILASLWTGAVGVNADPDKIAALLAGIPKLFHAP